MAFRHSFYRSAVGLCLLMTIQAAPPAKQVKVSMTNDRWTTVAGNVEFLEHMGNPSIELKPGNFAQHIASGQAVLKGLTFRTGTIEYDVDAAAGMGAGFAFRRSNNDNYEEVYLRPQPKCDQAPGCIQYTPQSHGVLMWDLFPQYQSPAPLRQGEWNHVKLVISSRRMNIFINGAQKPTLKVGRLEGDNEEGGLMLQGPGIFSNLTVTPDARENLPGNPEKDATASDRRYIRDWQISPFSKLAVDQIPSAANLPASGAAWMHLEAERNGLLNASRIYGLPFPRPERGVVWMKTKIRSSNQQQKHVSIGWAREIWVFVNGQQVFANKNLYMPKEARKEPDGRLSLQNGSFLMPLKAGDNEVAVAIANNFYGWGLMMHFDHLKGLHLLGHDNLPLAALAK
ncbi:MAG TPA: hypothetical protein VGG97_14015 [Bryobacteraceae bacterium]